MQRFRWTAVGVALLGSCGNEKPPPSQPAPDAPPLPDAPPDSATNGPVDSPILTPPPGAACTAPIPTPYVPPATCALDGHFVPRLINTDHMRAALVARWRKCAGSPFANRDEVGIELTQDNHWYKIYLDGAGGLERGQGFDREGTYELLYEVDHVQLNLNIFGGGTVIIAVPEFTTGPVKLRLNNMGRVGDYIRDDDTGACLPP